MNKLQKNSGPRKDVMVSVKLPRSLVEELKDIQQINHFMDLSDEIRFVVRRYCLKFLNSQSDSPSLEMLAEQKRKEKLIEELSKIIDSLKENKEGDSK
ncbi:MAG TPA: hypothetical protein VEC16_05710 [Alphaproteobacteria bacterium]|nr:hypothetical protein [Alphaproteobacteria bacterium]